MDFGIFLKTFYLVFLVLASVGPGFLTIANIAMTRTRKVSATAVCGCFLGDCIYMIFGAICAKEVLEFIPKSLSVALSIFAVLFLFYIAYRFFFANVKYIETKKINKSEGLRLAISLFCLKMTSPICIVSYGIIFTQTINTGTTRNIISAILGGCFASLVENAVMVFVFSKLGKKISKKILVKVSKISAILIALFAISLIYKLIF